MLRESTVSDAKGEALVAKVQAIMGGTLHTAGTSEVGNLKDVVMKGMYGWNSQQTVTGREPSDIDVNPQSDAMQEEIASFTFGRFSVPHVGHKKLIEQVMSESKTHYIFVSPTEDSKRNPLPYENKINYLERLIPEANIVQDKNVHDLWDAIDYIEEQGHKASVFVVGTDQFDSFAGLLEKYEDDFELNIEIVECPRLDDISATELRQAVVEKRFEDFASLIPTDDAELIEEMWLDTSWGMGIQLSEAAAVIPTQAERKPTNLPGDVGTDSDLGDANDTQIRRRKAMKRFRAYLDVVA